MSGVTTPRPVAEPGKQAPPAALPRRRRALLWHSLALARRNLSKIRRNPVSISDAVIAPVTFPVIFVCMSGGAVSGPARAYLQRTLPAVLVLSAITAGLIATGASLFTGIKESPTGSAACPSAVPPR